MVNVSAASPNSCVLACADTMATGVAHARHGRRVVIGHVVAMHGRAVRRAQPRG